MPNSEVFGELQKNWGLLLVFGILLVVLGIIGLGMAVFLTLASVMFYGIMLLIGGAAQLGQSFKSAGWNAKLWHLMIALLYVLAGMVVIRNPLLASGLLTFILASAFVGVGLFRIFMAIQMRGTAGWILLLIGGVLALVLGIWMFAKISALSLVIIGLFISIELIANGWSAITVAIAAKAASRA
jgi:uncharacterized membrane protein HdeD (DUF308 family)